MGFYLLEYISGCQHHQTDLALLTPREAGDGRGRSSLAPQYGPRAETVRMVPLRLGVLPRSWWDNAAALGETEL